VRVYLVRHSVPKVPDPDDPNPDPGLSDEGRGYVQNLAQWMLDKDEVPNVIFASPKARTQETAEILRDAFGLPEVVTKGSIGPQVITKGSIGPQMSITKLLTKVANDRAMTRVMIVSHHETIGQGLRVLDVPNHPDPLAQSELRVMKVKRKDVSWKEHCRILPSELGGWDHY
jgi:phosphohistidine phosphatase SixA